MIGGGVDGGMCLANSNSVYSSFFNGLASIGAMASEIPPYVWLFALLAILFIVSLIVASPVLGIALLMGSILVLGCGISNYYQDTIYADIAGLIITTMIGALALIATSGGGAPALILSTFIGGSLIISRFSSRCVGA